MTPAQDMALYLQAQGQGTFAGTVGWAIYVACEPAQPDDVITAYDTGGQMAEPDCGIYHPSVQVRVRAQDYLTAYAKAKECRDLLLKTRAFVANGSNYIGGWGNGEITALGFDENNRALLTINVNLMKEI